MTSREDAAIQPFRLAIPQADLDDLQFRLARTRWPEELPGVGGAYGVTLASVRDLVAHWRSGYDWRAWEARLNGVPQFTTVIDGQNIHFLHVRAPRPDAPALILSHGWPGSIVEYLDVIPLLREDFHLVIPSLPGFAFSGPTRAAGWGSRRIAGAWSVLMARLGYARYGAVGSDAGALISPEVGRIDPGHVVGVHVAQVYSLPSGDPAELEALSPEERRQLDILRWYRENMMAYHRLHATQPQTLAFALADSPAGQLAWNYQLFGDAVEADFILTNVMLYWLTGTAASAARWYYEDAHAEPAAGPTTAPTAVAGFAGDFSGIRRFAERDHRNIVRWSTYDRGGHYAAHQAPELLAGDVREFFRTVL